MLNTKEGKRSLIITRIDRGLLTGVQAAELMGVSVRQVRRILGAYRGEGAAGLAHGNRGRRPSHSIDPTVRQRVLDLARTTYRGCNDQHLSELLEEREHLALSRSSVCRILRDGGLPSPRKRRAPQHRARRERYAQEGMLLQIDASRHPWLGERGPVLSLVGAIDDATNTLVAALFRTHEDAHGYFELLERIVGTRGRPLAVYRDRHGIFERAPQKTETIAEQLAGRRMLTQLGRALEELQIGSIAARSPQAKGRIERLWGTLQDRLVTERRLAGATTIDQANDVLAAFLPRYNARFAVPAAEAGSAYRPLTPSCGLERVLAFRYVRTVSGDNTVRLGGQIVQLGAGPHQRSYAHTRVDVCERLDGSLEVWVRDHRIATSPAPLDAPTLRARKGQRAAPGDITTNAIDHHDPQISTTRAAVVTLTPPKANHGLKHSSKPGPTHPWRTPFKQAMVTNS